MKTRYFDDEDGKDGDVVCNANIIGVGKMSKGSITILELTAATEKYFAARQIARISRFFGKATLL